MISSKLQTWSEMPASIAPIRRPAYLTLAGFQLAFRHKSRRILEHDVLNTFQDRQLLEKPVKMLKSKSLPACFLGAAIILLCGIYPVLGADLKVLHGHVPKVISSLTPRGRLVATNELRLAIGLPLRDPAGLD